MAKKENDEYIKYMTEKLVAYMETPQEVRKGKRETAKAQREPWLTRWFGVGAFGLVLWWRGKSERNPELIRTDIRDNSLME
ncbi:YqzE family protein [Paenibacillus solisilvae]|uniref:YqzE family protein n=1 Tax=Paenibacillus solisilvae TaxID=2486751 RepID=A0ABW0VXU4_9BACL